MRRRYKLAAVRRAEVLRAGTAEGGMELLLLDGPLAGERCAGVFHEEFGPAPEVGEVVPVNAVGVEMGLGTGGVAIVLPSASSARSETPENEDHFVKLPYTPLQFPARAGRQARDLAGMPVVVLPLHSHLAPACCAAAVLRPECRVAFVCQEGGALPVGFSDAVSELRGRGLLHLVVSSGSCFGGDVEVPNIYSGLLAAAREADLVVAGIGPGVVGTGMEYAHGGMAAALALNAACALGAEPVLAPRVSRAEGRERHLGLSHHTRSVLEAALVPCRVAFPAGTEEYFEGLPRRHHYERVEFGAAGWEGRFGVTFQSMGRGYDDDRVFFDAAAGAVWLAFGEVER